MSASSTRLTEVKWARDSFDFCWKEYIEREQRPSDGFAEELTSFFLDEERPCWTQPFHHCALEEKSLWPYVL